MQFFFNAQQQAELPDMVERNTKRYVEILSRVADDIIEDIKAEQRVELNWEDLTGLDIQVADL